MLGSRCRRLSGLQAHPVSALTLRARCSARRLAVAVTQLLCRSAHAHAAVTHISLVYVDAEHVVARLLEAKGGADAEAANTEQRHLSHHSSACVAASVIVHPHAFRAPRRRAGWSKSRRAVQPEARGMKRRTFLPAPSLPGIPPPPKLLPITVNPSHSSEPAIVAPWVPGSGTNG